MVGATVLVIQVVRVFPHVKTEKRFQSGTYRVTAVSFFGDMQFTVLVYGQPGPTRTKQSDCCCIEFFLEVLEAAEVTFDCFSQFASGFFLRRFRGELQEVQIVVQYLSGVIEYSSIRCGCNDFFYRFTFIFCSGHKAIQIIYIRL